MDSPTNCSEGVSIVALNQTQLARLQRKLNQLYASLLEEVRDALENSENQQYVKLIGGEPADSGDMAVGDALADLNLALIDRHVGEIRDIEATRERIQDGSFGVCSDCGADVDFERMLAYPTAKRCYSCQRLHEKTYAEGAKPTL